MEDSDDTTNDLARQTYALSLKGEGMTVDRKIDEATALEVIAIVMSSAGGTTTTTTATGDTMRDSRSQATRTRRRGAQSLREYLDAVDAKRNPDKILAIARHTIDGLSKGTVTRDEVRGRFKDAAEPVPGNYGRDFTWVVKNGWLAPDAADKNEYYVTDTGDAALDAKFSTEIRKKTGVTKTGRGARRRAKKATENDS